MDHSQRSGLLQTSKLLEKAADGNVPQVRRLQRFQNPCDDDIFKHILTTFCSKQETNDVLNRLATSIS